MPTDDRERNFEKAMARELRGDALNGLHCPDAETLAAYHERLLSPEEMATQKSHLASCARCQEILATIEITEAVSSEKEQEEDAEARSGSRALKVIATAPLFSKTEKAAGRETSNLREMPKPKAYFRWAVPAGAIAAGLLVWVAISSNWNQRKAAMQHSASEPVEIAENRDQKDAQLAAPRSEVAAPAAKTESALKADGDLKQVPGYEADRALTDELEKSTRMQSRSATNLPHGPRVAQNQVQSQIQDNANANEFSLPKPQSANGTGAAGTLSASLPPATPAEAPKRMEEPMKAGLPPLPAPAQASPDGGARKDGAKQNVQISEEVTAVTAEETKPAAKEKKALDADAGRQSLSYVQNEGTVANARMRDGSATGVTVIQTPDAKVAWLVLKDGSLRKLESGGKSSAVQSIGDGIKAIAGSAPDANTCWVLAPGNLVFRTVDGGKHWTQVASPVGGDFKTIAATDKQRAAVADATGAVKVTTTDGGATWVAVKP